MNATIEAQLRQVYQAIEQQQYPTATSQLERLVTTYPHTGDVWNALGRLQETTLDYQTAYHSYHQALKLTPPEDNLEVLNNLGILCFHLKKHTEAVQYLQTVAERDPHGMGWHNLASVYQQLSQPQLALAALRKIPFSSRTLLMHQMEVDLLIGTGELQAALKVLEQLRKEHPHQVIFYLRTATIYTQLQAFPTAIQYFSQGIAQCQHLEQMDQFLFDLQETSPPETWIAWCELAWNKWQRPVDLFRLIQMLPPPVCESNQAIQHYRHKLNELLDIALQLNFEELPKFYRQHHFYLAYHNCNDRELNRRLAALRTKTLPALMFEPAIPKPNEALRIGWVSAHFLEHSIMHCFKETIQTFLDAPHIDNHFFITVDQTSEGEKSYRYLQQTWGNRVPLQLLSRDIGEATAQIDAWKPHILIYPEIGMSPTTAKVASYRLASLQLALPGHPITTGIKTIDAYVSHAPMESPTAQTHYSERLIALPGVIHYKVPDIPQTFYPREALGLPQQPVYLCPMTLFRLHPDYDEVIRRILERDPQGQFWIPQMQANHFGKKIAHRLKTNLGTLFERIHFFPWQSREGFFNLLWHAEACLDPIYFGAGNTGYLASAVGVPLITLPGEFFRGRAMYGLYQMMEIQDCIATSIDDYVELAFRLANDAQWREQIRAKVRQCSGTILNNNQWNQAFLEWCIDSSALQQNT